jgi:hypothetical protein
MKKYFIILVMLISGLTGFAQQTQPDDDNDDKTERVIKIRDRMNQFIQDRLGLSKNEAEKFTPVFLRYFKEFNQTHRQFREDKLILQQKIIELRLHYRTEFRGIMDEQRANKVYVYEDEFRKGVIRMMQERRDNLSEKKTLHRNKLLFP